VNQASLAASDAPAGGSAIHHPKNGPAHQGLPDGLLNVPKAPYPHGGRKVRVVTGLENPVTGVSGTSFDKGEFQGREKAAMLNRHFSKTDRLGRFVTGFILALLMTVANVHAATVSAAVPEDVAHAPTSPSSLALLATGLGFLLIIRRRYRLR
jgi:hypothetical protein